MMLLMCALIVSSVTPGCAPAALLPLPAATSAMTSNSRGDSVSLAEYMANSCAASSAIWMLPWCTYQRDIWAQADALLQRFLAVIFVTGHGSIPLSVQAMKAGAMEFLTKPVDPSQLLRARVAERLHSMKARSR